MTTWGEVLDALRRDPMECAELLDWPAKLRLLEGFRQRENLGWSAPRLHLVDLQYSDVRLDKGLYNRLVARRSMKRLVTEQQVIDYAKSRLAPYKAPKTVEFVDKIPRTAATKVNRSALIAARGG